MADKYPKFSDFSEEEAGLEGDKKKIEEILKKDILIVEFRIGRSRYRDKDYLTLQFENGGNKYINEDIYSIFNKVSRRECTSNPLGRKKK